MNSEKRKWKLISGDATLNCPHCGKDKKSKIKVIVAIGPMPEDNERIEVTEA